MVLSWSQLSKTLTGFENWSEDLCDIIDCIYRYSLMLWSHFLVYFFHIMCHKLEWYCWYTCLSSCILPPFPKIKLQQGRALFGLFTAEFSALMAVPSRCSILFWEKIYYMIIIWNRPFWKIIFYPPSTWFLSFYLAFIYLFTTNSHPGYSLWLRMLSHLVQSWCVEIFPAWFLSGTSYYDSVITIKNLWF